MSEGVIKSGDSGDTAKVDSENRLHTFAVTQDEPVNASNNGDTFFITSGIINLTSTTISHVFFMKNSDTVDWIIDSVITKIGPSTGAPGLALTTTFSSGATGGTLISGGAAITPNNLNLGSPKTLTGTFLAGVEGSTISGGGSGAAGLVPSDQLVQAFTSGPLIIAPGTSMVAGVTPSAGNTSMDVQFDIVLYRNMNS